MLHQYDKNERNLLDEMSTKNKYVSELENKISVRASEHNQIVDDYEKELDNLRIEKTSYLKKLQELESELECKNFYYIKYYGPEKT